MNPIGFWRGGGAEIASCSYCRRPTRYINGGRPMTPEAWEEFHEHNRHALGKRLLDMSPAELDEVFDIAISRMVEMDRD